MSTQRQIGILLFRGVEELDAVGPWEVLAYWTQQFPGDGYEVFCASRTGGPVECAHGLMLSAGHSLKSMPELEVLLHPGGEGTRPLLDDRRHLGWLREQRGRVPLLASVCTGSLVYAAAGLLRGRPATTHRNELDRLREIDSTVKVRDGDRFVDDGDVVTSAGVSAGIDMALHLVGRLAGTERAREVRAGLQYAPDPPG